MSWKKRQPQHSTSILASGSCATEDEDESAAVEAVIVVEVVAVAAVVATVMGVPEESNGGVVVVVRVVMGVGEATLTGCDDRGLPMARSATGGARSGTDAESGAGGAYAGCVRGLFVLRRGSGGRLGRRLKCGFDGVRGASRTAGDGDAMLEGPNVEGPGSLLAAMREWT
jgi:hypothetical protein